ncbi:MAG TPA: hypothetical protein VFM18_11570, partial [Methanosarcina sp.]|nr:hypothetical protein [Methanosarcina sp.]
AAQKVVVTGFITDKLSKQAVRTVSVRNIATGATVVSRSAGQYSVTGSKGNILSFSATGYFTDTLTITDSVLQLERLNISLRPLAGTLPDVTVTAKLNPYQLDSLERRRNFLALVGEAKLPKVGKVNDLGFGVGVNLDYWKKRERSKRRSRELFDITEEEAYINYRWVDTLVHKYTRLNGDSLIDFMQEYRPTWDWLRQNEEEEDLVYYINKSLKQYFRREK